MSEAGSRAPSLEAAIRDGAARLAQSDSPLIDARALMKRASGLDDAGLIAQARAPLARSVAARFHEMIMRRADGEPVAYILGEKEFRGLTFRVTADVLIPRADSECLIDAAIESADRRAALRVVDLGVGSGALLCAFLSEAPRAFGVGVDRSAAALSLARANAAALALAGRAAFAQGDWLTSIAGAIDVMLVNPPYIPERDRARVMRDVSAFEPAGALFAGADGFAAYHALAEAIPARLAPGGVAVCEIGDDAQAKRLAARFSAAAPGARIDIVPDLGGRARAIRLKIPS